MSKLRPSGGCLTQRLSGRKVLARPWVGVNVECVICFYCYFYINLLTHRSAIKADPPFQHNAVGELPCGSQPLAPTSRIPAHSPGFPGSLQVFHEISQSPD